MKKTKLITALFISVLMVLAFAACGSSGSESEQEATEETATAEAEDVTMVANGDLQLAIPNKYKDLLVVETKENDPNGRLFNVAEKASIEAAEASDDYETDGAGWLFDIGTVDEDTMHDMLCGEMAGAEVFAKDADGNYYVFYHPTDFRLIRANNEEMDAAMDQWTELCEWADAVPDRFIADNAGLTEDKHGNTELDMYLAQIAYKDRTDYTISTTEAGPMKPGDVDSTPYTDKLLNGATYENADDVEAPDGEYVVLNFPKDKVRFDFFLAEGSENVIREVWGDNEQIYTATFTDDSIKASAVMQDWYHALMENAQ